MVLSSSNLGIYVKGNYCYLLAQEFTFGVFTFLLFIHFWLKVSQNFVWFRTLGSRENEKTFKIHSGYLPGYTCR